MKPKDMLDRITEMYGARPEHLRPTTIILSSDPEAANYPVMGGFDQWRIETYRMPRLTPGTKEYNEFHNTLDRANPTLEVPRDNSTTLYFAMTNEGNVRGPRAFEEQGISFRKNDTKIFKRLSRLLRETSAQAFFNPEEVKFTEFDEQSFGEEYRTVPESTWDGANLISRQLVDQVTANLPDNVKDRFRTAGGIEGTLMYQGGQYKGHFLVRDIEDMPGHSMLAVPKGSQKKEMGYQPKSGEQFYLGLNMVMNAHEHARTDVQTLVNLYHYGISNEQFAGWLQIENEQWLQDIKSGRTERVQREMFSPVSTQRQFESRMEMPLYRFILEGGRITDSPDMLREYSNMRRDTIMNKRKDRFQLPVQGMFNLELSNALTSADKMVRGLKQGEVWADFKAGRLFVNSYDYDVQYGDRNINVPEILSGGDQDDRLNILATKSGDVLYSRTPNAQGEYVRAKLKNFGELKKHGIDAINFDFAGTERFTPVESAIYTSPLQTPKPPGNIKDVKGLWQWTRRKISENVGVLGQYVDALTAGTLTFGYESPSKPDKISNIIDATVKNLGTDTTVVRDYVKEQKGILGGMVLSREAARRIGRQEGGTATGHWMDDLEDRILRGLEWHDTQVQGLGMRASFPEEVVNRVKGDALGKALVAKYNEAIRGKPSNTATYQAANEAAVSYLNTLGAQQQEQAILQALVNNVTGVSGAEVRNTGFMYQGALGERTFKTLEDVGYLTPVKNVSELRNVPNVSSSSSAIAVLTGLGEGALHGMTLSELDKKVSGMQVRPVQEGGNWFLESGEGERLGQLSGSHLGGMSDLTAGRVSRWNVRGNSLILNLSSVQFRDEQRQPEAAHGRYTAADVKENVFAYARLVEAGEENVNWLPEPVAKSVLYALGEMRSPTSVGPAGATIRPSIVSDRAAQQRQRELNAERSSLIVQSARALTSELPEKFVEMLNTAKPGKKTGMSIWENKLRTALSTGIERYQVEENRYRVPMPDRDPITGHYNLSGSVFADINLVTGQKSVTRLRSEAPGDRGSLDFRQLTATSMMEDVWWARPRPDVENIPDNYLNRKSIFLPKDATHDQVVGWLSTIEARVASGLNIHVQQTENFGRQLAGTGELFPGSHIAANVDIDYTLNALMQIQKGTWKNPYGTTRADQDYLTETERMVPAQEAATQRVAEERGFYGKRKWLDRTGGGWGPEGESWHEYLVPHLTNDADIAHSSTYNRAKAYLEAPVTNVAGVPPDDGSNRIGFMPWEGWEEGGRGGGLGGGRGGGVGSPPTATPPDDDDWNLHQQPIDDDFVTETDFGIDVGGPTVAFEEPPPEKGIRFNPRANPHKSPGMMSALNERRSFIYQAPTGAGKSPILQYAIKSAGDKLGIVMSPTGNIAEMHEDVFARKAGIDRVSAFRGDPGYYDEANMDAAKYAADRTKYGNQRARVFGDLFGADPEAGPGYAKLAGPTALMLSYQKGSSAGGRLGNAIMAYAKQNDVSWILVDEAHMVMNPSQWMVRGMVDMYRKLAPEAKIGLVSATMEPWQARELGRWAGVDPSDIYQAPNDPDPRKRRAIISKSGIRYSDEMQKVIADTIANKGKSMVFMSSVDEVTSTVAYLNKQAGKEVAIPFHGAQEKDRALTPAQQARAKEQLNSKNPQYTVVGTGTYFGAGLHPEGYTSVIDATRGSWQEREQIAGRLTLPNDQDARGDITMIMDAADYRKAAGQIRTGLSKFNEMFDPIYGQLRGMYFRDELSKNYMIAQTQMEERIERELKRRGLKSTGYLAGMMMGLFQDESMIHPTWVKEGESGGHMEYVVEDQRGSHATTLERYGILNPADKVTHEEYMRQLGNTDREFEGMGNVAQELEGVTPEIAASRYGRRIATQLKASAPRLPGYEDLSAVLDNGGRIGNPEFTGPAFAEIEGARSAHEMVRERLRGASAISHTTQTSPAGARSSDRSAISDVDRGLPGSVIVHEDGRQAEVLMRPSRMIANAINIAPGVPLHNPAVNTGPSMPSNMGANQKSLAEVGIDVAESLKKLDKAIIDNIGNVEKQSVAIQQFVKEVTPSVQRADYVSAANAGLIARTTAGASGPNYDAYISAQQGLVQTSVVGTGDPDAGSLQQRGGGRGGGRNPAVGVMYAAFHAQRLLRMTLGDTFTEALQSTAQDYNAPAMVGTGGTDYRTAVAGAPTRALLGKEYSGRGAYEQFGAFMEIPYAMSGGSGAFARNMAGFRTGGAIGSAFLTAGLEMGMTASFMPDKGMPGWTESSGRMKSLYTGLSDAMKAGGILVGGTILGGTAALSVTNMLGMTDNASLSSVTRTLGQVGIIAGRALSDGRWAPTEQFAAWAAGPTESEGAKAVRERSEVLAGKMGGAGSDYVPLLTAMSRVNKGGFAPNQENMEKFLLSAQGKGMAGNELTSTYLQTAAQMGFAPNDPRYGQLMTQMTGMDYAGVYRLEQQSSRVAQLSGQLAPYVGSQAASNIITGGGFAPTMNAFGVRQVQQSYEAFGRQGYNLDAIVGQTTETTKTKVMVPNDMFDQPGKYPDAFFGAEPTREATRVPGYFGGGKGGGSRSEKNIVPVPYTDVPEFTEKELDITTFKDQTLGQRLAAIQKSYGYNAYELATSLAPAITQMGGGEKQVAEVTETFAKYFAKQGFSPYQTQLAGQVMGGDLGAASFASYMQPGMLKSLGQTVEGSRAYNMSGQAIFQTNMMDFIKFGMANVGTVGAAEQGFGGVAGTWGAFQDQAAGTKADMLGKGQTSFNRKEQQYAKVQAQSDFQSWYQSAEAAVTPGIITDFFGWNQGNLTGAQQKAVSMFSQGQGLQDYGNWAFQRQHEINLQQMGIQQQQFQAQVQNIATMRPLEDQMRQMGYQSQMADFGAQRQRMQMGNEFAIKQEGISGERMKIQQQYQLWSANFEYAGALQQREWTKQDWQYQDQTRAMQFGWNMEDMDTAIRRSSGFERRQLIKQKGRAVTTQGMEEGQIETQRERQGEVWAREDERYKKQTEYIKKLMGLDEEQFKLNISQRQEFYELDMKNLARHQSEYQKQYELQTKIQQIERAYQDQNLEFQKEQLALQAESYDIQHTLEEVTRKANQEFEKITGEMQMMSKYGGNIINILKALGEASKAIGSNNVSTLNATTEVFRTMRGLTVSQLNAIRELLEAAATQ